MRPKISVYIATSVDGFIARQDGNLDWLDAAGATVPKGEDCGYQALMDTVDVLVMGRKTFQKVVGMGPWPYGETQVIVLSHSSISIPASCPDTVSSSSKSPAELAAALEAQGIKHVYIDGGNTIQRFLIAGLVDEMTITSIPILLGQGIRLFGSLESDILLTPLATKAYDFGFVQTKYSIHKVQY